MTETQSRELMVELAARPNEPELHTLRHWITALEQATSRNDRDGIKAVLQDAVPEFASTAA